MFRRVMVAVDGSAFSEQAIGWASVIARAASARLHLVMVHEGRALAGRGTIFVSEHVDAQQREMELDYLATLAERVGAETGLEVDAALRTGVPAAALAAAAARRKIDLLVLSTHGRGGLSRLWLGSVADGVVRRSRVPVLLVRPAEAAAPPTPPAIRRVLAAVDGSSLSDIVLHEAAGLCGVLRAPCTIIRVVVPPTHIIASRMSDTAALVRQRSDEEAVEAGNYLRRIATATHWQATDIRAEVVTANDAAGAILRCAEEEVVDLIVIGTRGHGGAARLLLGSVADKVIRGAHVPVFVCPARAGE